jgi:hypothetical protein
MLLTSFEVFLEQEMSQLSNGQDLIRTFSFNGNQIEVVLKWDSKPKTKPLGPSTLIKLNPRG